MDIEVGGNNVQVTGKRYWMHRRGHSLRIFDEACEPSQLVLKVLRPGGVAVRQVDRSSDDTFRLGFQVSILHVGRVARQSTAHFNGCFALGKDGDAMVRALAMPYRAVTSRLDSANRKLAAVRLQFLQANDIGSAFREPFEQAREPSVYAVDVVRGNLHGTIDCARSRGSVRRVPCRQLPRRAMHNHRLELP